MLEISSNRISSGSPKILIVEDDTITAYDLRRTLTRLGYKVVAVSSGEAVLEQIEKYGPDLLLADIGLEGELDGIEIAARARRRWNIPTVFLTAYGDTETMHRARDTEPYGYLVKPFSERELQATVDIALQQRKLAAERERQSLAGARLLESTKEDLAAITARLLSVQDEERERIGRDLHDDYAQRLALLQMKIHSLQLSLPAAVQRESEAAFQSIGADLDKLFDDLRDLSHRMHPATIDHLGLAPALRQLSDDFAEHRSIPVEFSARGVPATVPPPISIALYRIAQEALQNVARHAGRASVTITLYGRTERPNLCIMDLTIRDTGKGFDPDRKKNGLGVISMEQRAQSVDGSFQLISQLGQGTEIQVSVPFPADATNMPDCEPEP